jgi:hypothetical protein
VLRHFRKRSEPHLTGIEAGHLARPDRGMEITMKNLIFAAIAALSLSASVAPTAQAAVFHNGSSIAGDEGNSQWQRQGAI